MTRKLMNRALTLSCVSLFVLPGTAHATGSLFFSVLRAHDSSANPPNLYPLSGTNAKYTYCPAPGHAHRINVPTNTYIHDVWDLMTSENQPVAFLIRNRNTPWGTEPRWDTYDSTYPGFPTMCGATPCISHPGQLAHGVADRYIANDQIDYVLGSIEKNPSITFEQFDTSIENISTIINGLFPEGVTGNPGGGLDVNVPQSDIQNWAPVHVGNYRLHRYPILDLEHSSNNLGNERTSVTTPGINQAQGNPAYYHDMFVDHGLSVIMPVSYMYAAHVLHSKPGHWSEVYSPEHDWAGISPSTRAGYLWAGVEATSSAIREELGATGTLAEKKIIPWITPFVSQANVTNPQSGV